MNLRGCGLSEARRSRSSFRRFLFVSATMVVCNSSRASCLWHQPTASGLLVREETHHPPTPNRVLLRAPPLENVRKFITPPTCGEFHALIAPPGQLRVQM